MKNFIALLLFVFSFLISNQILSQGYFISSSGNYLSTDKFRTNAQNDLSKYEGSYTAVSETYESAYTFIISPNTNSVDLNIISSACMDGENWEQDTFF